MAFTYLTLPQLAKLAGVRPDDIRFYIERGLLQGTTGRRSRRDDRGFRQEHLDRLRFIQRALAYGLSVDAIARFVDPYRMTTCNDVYRIAVAELEALRRARGSEDPTVMQLEGLVDRCAGIGGSKDCSILATLKGDAGMADAHLSQRGEEFDAGFQAPARRRPAPNSTELRSASENPSSIGGAPAHRRLGKFPK